MKPKKKNSGKPNFPFVDEIKQAKHAFKAMIDEMSDGEFVDFNMLFLEFLDDQGYFDDDDYCNECDECDGCDEGFEECEDLPF